MDLDKKPSYLYEVFDSASEEEAQEPNSEEKAKSRYSVFICKEIKHQPKCFLCGNLLKLCFDLTEHVEGSEHTFSDVLAKLLSRERLPASLARKDYSQGLLCTECRDLVKNLFCLQRELRTVKNVIIRTFRNTESKDIGDLSTDESDSEVDTVQKRMKLRKTMNDVDKDEIKSDDASRSLKRKQKKTQKPDEVKLIRKRPYNTGKQNTPNKNDKLKRKRECTKNISEEILKTKVDEFLDMDMMDSINTCIKEVEEENCKSVDEISVSSNGPEQVSNVKRNSTTRNAKHIDKAKSGKSGEGKNKKNKQIIQETESTSEKDTDLKDIRFEREFDDIYLLFDEYLKEEKSQATKADKMEPNNVSASVDEDVFNIEALISKKRSTYLVKWENYPEDQNTWEPKSSIPDHIIQYYEEDPSRLGEPLPSDLESFEDSEDDNWKPTKAKKATKELTKKIDKNYPKVSVEKEKRNVKAEQGSSKNKENDDDNAIIDKTEKGEEEKTIELLLAKDGGKYLVKWKNLSNDENTWEHRTAIPNRILNFYERDLSRLGFSPYISYI